MAMRKLGVDEWLIRIVMTMNRDSNIAITVNNTMGDKFCVSFACNSMPCSDCSALHGVNPNYIKKSLM